MIWFILGLAPFALLFLYWLVKYPAAVLSVVALLAAIYGLLFLSIYGAWQMNWLEHCGDFWESYSCP